MCRYTSDVILSPDKRGNWILKSNLAWRVLSEDTNLVLLIEKNKMFTSDLASIPWYLRWLFDRGDSRLAKAALLHDYALSISNINGRATAASIFYEALLADGINPYKAKVMFLGVLFKTVIFTKTDSEKESSDVNDSNGYIL